MEKCFFKNPKIVKLCKDTQDYNPCKLINKYFKKTSSCIKTCTKKYQMEVDYYAKL